MTHGLLTFVLLALTMPLGAAQRQTNDESAAIRATALDYSVSGVRKRLRKLRQTLMEAARCLFNNTKECT